MRSQIGHVEGRSEGKDLVFGSDAFFSRILAGATSGFFSAMASVGVGSRTLTARINPLAWMVLNFEDISREQLEILPEHALAFAMVRACWMMTWMTTSLLYLLASQLRWTHLMAIMARICPCLCVMITLTQIRQASHARLGEHSVLASCAIPNDILQHIIDTPRARDRQCHRVPGNRLMLLQVGCKDCIACSPLSAIRAQLDRAGCSKDEGLGFRIPSFNCHLHTCTHIHCTDIGAY